MFNFQLANMKRVLSILAFILGEIVLIAVLRIYVLPALGEEIAYLDIAVSSIIYMSLFIDVFFAWVNLKDKSHREVGGIGIRWMSVLIYGIVAIAVMVIGGLCELSFTLQLIIHLGLFVFYILGWSAVLTAESKVAGVYEKEKQKRQGINEIKSFVRTLRVSAKNIDTSPETNRSIEKLEEELRYISPSDSAAASAIDADIMRALSELERAILTKDEGENILRLTNKCENLICERRRTY